MKNPLLYAYNIGYTIPIIAKMRQRQKLMREGGQNVLFINFDIYIIRTYISYSVFTMKFSSFWQLLVSRLVSRGQTVFCM